jgi:hypothetical protein
MQHVESCIWDDPPPDAMVNFTGADRGGVAGVGITG